MQHDVVKLAVILLAGCGFHGKPIGGDDDDGGGITQTIVDDTAADFTAGVLDEAAIDPTGLVEPGAYVLGGLHAVGYNTKLFDATKTTFDSIADVLATATILGAGYAQIPDDWAMSRPFGLGLPANSDGFTIVYNGQIHLTAGIHTTAVSADDAGIVELDLGSGFQTLAAVLPIVPRDGWYPIRAAIAEGTMMAKLAIQIDGGRLAPDVLRAQVNDARGVLAALYTNGPGVMLAQSAVAAPTIEQDYGMAAPPYDVPMITAASFFIRYAGQFYAADDRDYVFAPSAPNNGFDLAVLWLDRHVIARQGATVTQHLAPGWHGIAVDFSAGQANGGHDMKLALTVDGQNIPNASLRPAATTGAYVPLLSGKLTLNDANDGGGPTTTLMLPPPAALPPSPLGIPQTIDSVDLGWFEFGGNGSDYTSTVTFGAFATMLPAPATFFGTGFGAFDLADEHLRDLPLPTAPGSFAVTDHVQGGGKGSAQGFANATLHGGPAMPFAPHWVYTSAQHPTLGASALGAITVASTGDGAMVLIEVRTTPDDSAWVTVANGATPATDAGDFVQYRITIDGDGWQFPTIDKVAIDYVTPAL